MSLEDSSKIKKSILMRYPDSFLSEVSRALIGYKSYRDVKQYYRALPIMDSLIDLVTLDPKTRKRYYELDSKDIDQEHTIQIPKDLIEDFKMLFIGPRDDGLLALKSLSPSKTVDPMKGIVIVRKPINFIEAWHRYDPEYIILKGGFYYKETRYNATQFGMMPYEVMVPLIDFSDPNLQYHETDTIPWSWWAEMYDKGWERMSTVCTLIEKVIAMTLEEAGYSSQPSAPTTTEPGDNDASDKKPWYQRLKL